MCGRYELNDDGTLDSYYPKAERVVLKSNYNTAPTQMMPVVAKLEDGPKIYNMKWGIHRQIGPKIEKDIINTRADKATGRFWGKNIREQRCLIPATGFYEWRIGDKQPFFIHPKNRKLYFFAGIYAQNSEGQYTYSIMTTDPNKEMNEIHNRMPVILEKAEEKVWLDDNYMELLNPYKDGGLAMHPISREVNSVKNNYPELSKAI